MFSSSLSAPDEPATVAERVRRQRTAKKIKAKTPVTKNSDKWRAAGEGSADKSSVRYMQNVPTGFDQGFQWSRF